MCKCFPQAPSHGILQQSYARVCVVNATMLISDVHDSSLENPVLSAHAGVRNHKRNWQLHSRPFKHFMGNKPYHSSNRWRHIIVLWKADTYKDLTFLFQFWKFNTEWPCVLQRYCSKHIYPKFKNGNYGNSVNSGVPMILLTFQSLWYNIAYTRAQTKQDPVRTLY